MKSTKSPPKQIHGHWYALTFSGRVCAVSCMKSLPDRATAMALSQNVRNTCEHLRFMRIPAVDAYRFIRRGIASKIAADMMQNVRRAAMLSKEAGK